MPHASNDLVESAKAAFASVPALQPLSEWVLTPGVTHLSHGSYGGLQRRVFEAQLRHQREIEERPDSYFFFEAKTRLSERRDEVARTFAAAPGNLVLVGGAMTGLFTVLRSLPWRAGDEILYTNHGYRLVENALKHLATRHGVVPRRIDVPLPLVDPQDMVDALRTGFGPRTRLVVIDHITSPTALLFPVKACIALAREHGVPILVDGAHAPGHVDLDLANLDADFYVGNLHKWVAAPRGTGFLYAHERHHAVLEAPVVTTAGGSFEERFLFGGTGPIAQILALDDALAAHAELERANYRTHAHGLVTSFRDAFLRIFRATPVTDDTSLHGNFVALPVPVRVTATRAEEIHYRQLFFEKHRMEVPFTSIPGDDRLFVRPSAHAYSSGADFSALLAALVSEFSEK